MSHTAFDYAELQREGYQAIGHLSSQWAMLENVTFRCLIASIGVDEPVGRALVGGARWGDLVSMLKRVAVAKKIEGAPLEIELIQKEANLVKAIRDIVAHKTMSMTNDETPEKLMFVYAQHKGSVGPPVARYSCAEIETCAKRANLISLRVATILHPLMTGESQQLPEKPLLQAWRGRPPLPKAPDLG